MVVKMVVRPIAKLSERARYNEPLVMDLSMLRRRASNDLAAIWRKTLCRDAVARPCVQGASEA